MQFNITIFIKKWEFYKKCITARTTGIYWGLWGIASIAMSISSPSAKFAGSRKDIDKFLGHYCLNNYKAIVA